MILLIHILIALTSLGFATYVWLAPSRRKLGVTYGLVAATIATGTYVALINPAHLTQACTSGLVYLGAMACAILAARAKLARA